MLLNPCLSFFNGSLEKPSDGSLDAVHSHCYRYSRLGDQHDMALMQCNLHNNGRVQPCSRQAWIPPILQASYVAYNITRSENNISTNNDPVCCCSGVA